MSSVDLLNRLIVKKLLSVGLSAVFSPHVQHHRRCFQLPGGWWIGEQVGFIDFAADIIDDHAPRLFEVGLAAVNMTFLVKMVVD